MTSILAAKLSFTLFYLILEINYLFLILIQRLCLIQLSYKENCSPLSIIYFLYRLEQAVEFVNMKFLFHLYICTSFLFPAFVEARYHFIP